MIVGNDMAKGDTVGTTQEIEEGEIMDETVDIDDGYEDIHTSLQEAIDLDDEDVTFPMSNHCSALSREINHLTSLSRRQVWKVPWMRCLIPLISYIRLSLRPKLLNWVNKLG